MAPTLSVSKYTDFIKSNEMVTVASAIIVTPLILASVVSLGTNLPVIGNNVWLVLLIASFVVFGLSSMVPAGILRSVVMGVGAGLFINFLIINPATRGIFSRLQTVGK